MEVSAGLERAPRQSDSAVSKAGAHAPENVWEKWLCVCAVVGTLTAAASLFWYAHPWADDFSRGYKGRLQGVVPATINEYYNWTGRWAAAGLNYLLTSSFDLVSFYTPLLLIVPLLLATSVFLLLRAARIGATRIQSFFLAFAALALYWNGMPDPGETVYWLTGSVDNLTGFSLSLSLLAALLRFNVAGTGSTGAAAAVALALLAFLATGFHEVFTLVLCTALAGGALHAWLARNPNRWIWTACLLAALIGFLVVYIAPGNEVRRGDFLYAGDLKVTIALTLKQSASNILLWILDIRLLTGTLLLVALTRTDPSARVTSEGVTLQGAVIVGLTWVAVVVGAFAAVSWAIGMTMAPRTLNGIYLVFLVGWFWFVVLTTRRFSDRVGSFLTASPMILRLSAVVFAVAMLLGGNTWKAIVDLNGAAPIYSAALGERWRSLAAASSNGERDAIVRPLPARPKSYIKYFELTGDPQFWVNWSVAHYFGLESVRLAEDEEKRTENSTNSETVP